MPSSVGDRLTNTHEFVYYFTRQPTYHFDLNAIREPTTTTAPAKRRPMRAAYPPREAVPFLAGGAGPRVDLNYGLAGMKAAGRDSHHSARIRATAWSLATASYRGAHFATFLVEPVRPPLLATCPERVCTACGTPWRQVPQVIDGRQLATRPQRAACRHADWRPGIVLDPFTGSGTVAIDGGNVRARLVGHRVESPIMRS